MVGLSTLPAAAGNLGTAGPFHAVGGERCEGGGTSDAACGLPRVDDTAPPARQAMQQIARARRFFDLLRMEEAKAALDKAIALDPTDSAALLLRGRSALSEGDGVASMADINAALRLAPNDGAVLATKAFMDREGATAAQALADANRAVGLAPDDPDVRYVRSTIYMANQRPDLAFADLTFTLAKDPDNDLARQSRAQALLRRSDYAAAVHDATILLQHSDRDMIAHQVRATANIALGDDEAALADLDWLVGPSPMAAVRRATPAFQPTIVERAGVLARLKRGPDATAAVETMVGDGGLRAVLHMQVYLHNHGYPGVLINGKRSDAFDTALAACFADRNCGPRLRP